MAHFLNIEHDLSNEHVTALFQQGGPQAYSFIHDEQIRVYKQLQRGMEFHWDRITTLQTDILKAEGQATAGHDQLKQKITDLHKMLGDAQTQLRKARGQTKEIQTKISAEPVWQQERLLDRMITAEQQLKEANGKIAELQARNSLAVKNQDAIKSMENILKDMGDTLHRHEEEVKRRESYLVDKVELPDIINKEIQAHHENNMKEFKAMVSTKSLDQQDRKNIKDQVFQECADKFGTRLNAEREFIDEKFTHLKADIARNNANITIFESQRLEAEEKQKLLATKFRKLLKIIMNNHDRIPPVMVAFMNDMRELSQEPY